MQNKYHQLKLLEIELRQDGSGPPPPGKISIIVTLISTNIYLAKYVIL